MMSALPPRTQASTCVTSKPPTFLIVYPDDEAMATVLATPNRAKVWTIPTAAVRPRGLGRLAFTRRADGMAQYRQLQATLAEREKVIAVIKSGVEGPFPFERSEWQ